VGQSNRLLAGDELLEVNGHQLLGLSHVEVVVILKELPLDVRMVCARPRQAGQRDIARDSVVFEERDGDFLELKMPPLDGEPLLCELNARNARDVLSVRCGRFCWQVQQCRLACLSGNVLFVLTSNSAQSPLSNARSNHRTNSDIGIVIFS